MTGFDFECSADGGATWTAKRSVDGDRPTVEIGGLTNGTDYVCRAFKEQRQRRRRRHRCRMRSGRARASSAAIRSCWSLSADCGPARAGLAVHLLRRMAGRAVYVTAQVDQFALVWLGRGPKVGMAFVRRGQSNRVAGIVPAEGRSADVRIRYAGGVTFEVASGGRKRKTEFGRPVQVTDRDGRVHELVLRAYDRAAAAGTPRRRLTAQDRIASRTPWGRPDRGRYASAIAPIVIRKPARRWSGGTRALTDRRVAGNSEPIPR